ncbi:flavin reductase [Streptomyces ipomoeae]|jgi:flavin reductase (DIM6/NTAB) family NADH-FMN oxidoreductase RutF|uniref:Flavin reductase-like protein n=2 Tax=Streptomyces ipomoeae TaxID=103232 RepID=L1KVH4_9ACTN|nr:flavin reductase family protein [Streptomyces ipomoeae]EKX64373.1 flavin reductase-like protein [Streptomyces ipomoeae 91-03]MDX2693022.1 flavin reductase family protein [Streptomyces ipomoeae]MDX2820806.1 flavin reductase family protein [Streptomyces ipomoeae]MDX2838528.1 flavin reductase family protein [Streptomyces ipomoeae]MDX2872584.1 flavin reductase family protein [Streptomyces ipomoeae]
MSPDLRGTMRNFATGVCVAATYADRESLRRHDAVTLNSLTSVSLDPPLVSLSLHRDSQFLSDLLDTKKWAISILDSDAEPLARQLAKGRDARAEAVAALPATPGPVTGALMLDAQCSLECVLWDSFDLGDHTMVIGEVVSTGNRDQQPPLLFLHGNFHQLATATTKES